ncbi:hypothetical protein Tco_0245643 [Tanacetum coccineum]
MSPAALRVVTRGHETQLLNLAKLRELGIVRFDGVGQTNIVSDRLDDSDEKFKVVEVRRAQEEDKGSPGRCPNMSFTNRHRVMDDRHGEIYKHIYKLGGEMEKLTKVMSGMSEQYDEFYGEFRLMRLAQEKFYSWNSSHMIQLLSYHHLNHTRFDGTQYTYVPNIPDLCVQ